jgi:hypothetical protein
MISLEKCEAYLNECQALGADAKLTLRRGYGRLPCLARA